MSQQTVNSDVETKNPIREKVIAQLNEERLVKDASTVQLSKIKLLDDLTLEINESSIKEEIKNLLSENLKEHPTSLVSRYILGGLDLINDNSADGMAYFRSLIEDFRKSAKWTIVDHIADQILGIDDNNRTALRAKVESTERLKGKKELKPFLEKLAAIDRKNPDVGKKYALSILDEDKETALKYLKQAGEIYARQKDYKNLEEVWNIITSHDYEDLTYFERIERILVGNREKTRAAAYLVNLVEPHKLEENWPVVITLLKKILEYEPTSAKARTDLVRAYRSQFEGHSLLEDLLKMSEITNHKKSVGPCVASFERNIVFDKDNYVYHRTRGVGKILSIDSDHMIIDFRDNPGQKMTVQMAISSLQPLVIDHIWVKNYEKPEEVQELFKTDVPGFFEELLSSFGNTMTLAEIKAEVVPTFLTPEEWSKWWSRARAQLKKSDRFGFNPKKKDELILRENPMTLSEELLLRFQGESDWNKRLDLALESLKDQEGEDALASFMQHYLDQENSKDKVKRIHSFLFVDAARALYDDDEVIHRISRSEIIEIIKKETKKGLVQIHADTTAVDFKREIINLIIKNREDYEDILSDILFEVPIKINRYIVSELSRLGKIDTLQKFLKRAFSRYREHPEIFLWSARSILTGQWNYEWINVSKKDVLLVVFRLLKPLVQIEKKGTRLKNSALEAIFGSTNITVDSIKESVLAEVIEQADASTIRRMAALFRDVPYVADAHKENLYTFLDEVRPGYSKEVTEGMEEEEEEEKEEVSLFPAANIILVSRDGLEKKKTYLDHLINVEMPANSHDIGEAQEKGDLRENAEYKAAMEKQATLRAEITTLNDELKRTHVIEDQPIRTDIVTIGTRVTAVSKDGEEKIFTILGPWDVDAEQNIISYVSPLGKVLIGKKVGEKATLDEGNSYTVKKITSTV